MKHIETINLRNQLNSVSGLKSHEVNYAIQMNLDLLKVAIKPLEKQEKEIGELLKDYEEQRIKLAEKFATVDGVVKKKENGSQFDIPKEELKNFEEEVVALQLKHKVAIDENLEKKKVFVKFMEETESPFVPYKIKFKHVPEDISTENMKAIFPLIESRNQ